MLIIVAPQGVNGPLQITFVCCNKTIFAVQNKQKQTINSINTEPKIITIKIETIPCLLWITKYETQESYITIKMSQQFVIFEALRANSCPLFWNGLFQATLENASYGTGIHFHAGQRTQIKDRNAADCGGHTDSSLTAIFISSV